MSHARQNRDTTLGGRGREFPSTCWSRFRGLGAGADARRASVERLAADYWKPIYAYVRARTGRPNEDAKDLTQDFFVWMMETDFLGRADPERGRFRAFVKVALQHYLQNEDLKTRRLKRGGGRPVVAIEGLKDREIELNLPDPSSRTPEELLDAAWRNEVLRRAMAQLEAELVAEDRALTFRIFRDGYVRREGRVSYPDLAAQHAVTEADVFNHFRVARDRLRAIVTGIVAETVEGEADLQDELKVLFG